MLKKLRKRLVRSILSEKARTKFLQDVKLRNKTVLVRVDYNVPLKKVGNGLKIVDNEKIITSIPTIKYLLANNCKIILMSHLGRPKGKSIVGLRLNPVAQELKRLLVKNKIKSKLVKLNDCIGPEVKAKVRRGKFGDIFLLENLRFYKEEEENDYAFAHSLADLAEIYVNDAFAVSHRKHASLIAITKFIPSVAGLMLQTEILNLKRGLVPERPAVWLMGGAKLKKVELLESALSRADHILIGGALCFSFLKAGGISVGHSLIDYETVKIAKRVLGDKRSNKIVLPVDFVCTKKISPKSKVVVRAFNEIPNDEIALDIGPKTLQLFELHLNKARTIVWNGPMGYFELDKFVKGSKVLAKEIGALTTKNRVFSIVGGGETAAMIKKFKLKNKFTHISTGGGASLMFLSGKKLPAISALEESRRVFEDK